ncbi:MAG: hypothetical protein LUD48_05150 [Prevotella sp.]|nr:hypothetical protein [Prevotella sp.]
MIPEQDNYQLGGPMRRRRNEEEKPDRFLKLRNILNTVFIVGAIVGVLVFIYKGEQLGTIIILCSMMFKIVECVFRFMK